MPNSIHRNLLCINPLLNVRSIDVDIDRISRNS